MKQEVYVSIILCPFGSERAGHTGMTKKQTRVCVS